MKLEDYDRVYALLMSCTGVGLNDLDDSWEGIGKYLGRNPQTCFVAQEGEKIVGVILSAMMAAGDTSTIPPSIRRFGGGASASGWFGPLWLPWRIAGFTRSLWWSSPGTRRSGSAKASPPWRIWSTGIRRFVTCGASIHKNVTTGFGFFVTMPPECAILYRI